MPRLVDLLLATGAALRLTRLVTTDWVGFWWFREPAHRWASKAEADEFHRRVGNEHERAAARGHNTQWLLRDGRTVEDPFEFVLQDWDETEPHTWQAKLVKGLDCQWCVGYWLGVLVLGSWVLVTFTPLRVLRPLWRFVMGTLALNVVVNALGDRLGTYD